ncbi:glycosyltransferase family 2 protein [Allorhizocola rhizosphaerae]|uniref:glycosyltransferase family 2 protein n=1 Tax=Allorhizocola rhizosphaerae TaxID=1872709 RepID=UPI001B8CF0D5|nr:glycosyltransferase family 2 protein [Allorhizocola rhizosphaerae]
MSVVVPCYRSARTLPQLIERLQLALPPATEAYEVLLVVDGSPDDTWSVAHRLADSHVNVRAIRLARNYGQHSALIAGIRAAEHDVIVTMDDDLQHPPEEIPRMLEALTDDVDVVYGVPFEEEHGALRSFASRAVKASMARLIEVKHARSISSFRAFRSFVREAFDQIHGPDGFVDVALSWATTRVIPVKIRMDHRSDGRSTYTVRTLTRYAVNMIVGFSAKPLRFVTYLGMTIGLAGLALLGRVLWDYYSGATKIEGYTTVASMVAIFSSAQLVAIGVLGEYVGRVHNQGMGKPTYIIRENHPGTSADSASMRRPAHDPPNQQQQSPSQKERQSA